MQDPTLPNNQQPSIPPTPGVPAGPMNGGMAAPLQPPTSLSGQPQTTPNLGQPAGNPMQGEGVNSVSATSPMQSTSPNGTPVTPAQPSAGGDMGSDSAKQQSGQPDTKDAAGMPKKEDVDKDGKKVPASAGKDDKAAGKSPARTEKSGEPDVKKVDIEKIVSSWTGIPITKLTEDEGAKLLNLEKRIHQRLIDQAEAVTAVAEAVRRGRIGLAAANRPIASFIFLGPSGTGKTELAKTLAEILFGKDDALVRLDMSEYMEKHEVAKLIGAPPGYVGYEEGGQLTEAVRAKPYSIVLLDEVEKAHPDVFNILLQLLEDGRLTDNKGNTISFKNTIVICTSNIGSALITQKLGEKEGKELTEPEFVKEFSELTTLVNGELRKFFRPELLNRFDDIVIFKPLRRQDMKAIAKLGIEKTSKLLEEQEIKLKISDKALAQLALEGYDPVYGARPLRRLIQTAIENPIAVLIIAKTFVAGDTIMIDYDTAKTDYSFRKATPEEIVAQDKKAEEEKKQKESGMTSQDSDKTNPDPNAKPKEDEKKAPSGTPPVSGQKQNNPMSPGGNATAPLANQQKPGGLPPTQNINPPAAQPGASTQNNSQVPPANGLGVGQPVQPNIPPTTKPS